LAAAAVVETVVAAAAAVVALRLASDFQLPQVLYMTLLWPRVALRLLTEMILG
jgi:hypothetical protein